MDSTMTAKVRFPLGGRWRMLRWYEINRGHHLLMAKRHSSILVALQARLRRVADLEIRGYWEIDIFAPSPKMDAMAFAVREDEMRDSFWQNICWRARQWEQERKKLPPGLRQCSKFVPIEDPNGWSDECDGQHRGCQNCHDGIVVESPEAFYAERRAMFEASQIGRRYGHSDGCVSRAVPAADGQILRAAIADFGHHEEGIHLSDHIDQSYVPGSVIFYYTVVKELSQAEPGSMVKAVQRELKHQRNLEGIEYRKKQKRDAERDSEEFLALLKGPVER